MIKVTEYKNIIKGNLYNVIDSGYIPELGLHKAGKVRDVHFTSKEIGKPIIMVASDRVSVFDHILNRRIPFKGQILNLLNKWAFEHLKDIIPNASLESPHTNVLIQKYYKNIMVECVVRGYVWGSLAQGYEEGKREICSIELPNNLLRYQKLGEPLFTPATKAESGHDENLSFDAVEKKLGKEIADKVKNVSISLYKKGAEVALERGLLFIDTKYEFGLDESGNLYLIDEANTPDSSRYCTIEEYKKFKLIENEMKTGKYKNVSELLKIKPELKIEELSKQFVRDVIIEKGFNYTSTGEIPELEDEDVVEVSYRYIYLYEMLTGQDFEFPESNVRSDLIDKLKMAGYINGCIAVIMAGSDSDMLHIEAIRKELEFYNIKSEIRICSAHKQPTKCEEIVNRYNQSLEPVVFVCVAGGTDALSGVVSFHSVYPVISCPPNKDEYLSCINNPSGSSNSLIVKPANAAKHIAQIFGQYNKELQKKLIENSKNKILKLELADSKLIGLV